MSQQLLEVKDLTVSFALGGQEYNAVNGISFNIQKGQTLGLVGESGCGKSVTSLAILSLIDAPGRIASGEINFLGKNLLTMTEKDLRGYRGNEISMIFQEPMTSLNPVFTVGNQVGEVLRIHQGMDKKQAREATIEMLRKVKIPSPEKRVDEYPHQLSGGMRQRVMIAIALACKPKLLIADEPTTALDVTIQAQILELIREMQDELEMAVLLITHDLGVVAEVCDHVMVMYAGNIVEDANINELFLQPKHPYTQGLLASIPKLGHKVDKLPSIKGMVPSLGHFPKACRFSDRCPHKWDLCTESAPQLKKIENSHNVRCWLHDGDIDGNS